MITNKFVHHCDFVILHSVQCLTVIPPQLPFLRHTNPLGQSPGVPPGFPFPSNSWYVRGFPSESRYAKTKLIFYPYEGNKLS